MKTTKNRQGLYSNDILERAHAARSIVMGEGVRTDFQEMLAEDLKYYKKQEFGWGLACIPKGIIPGIVPQVEDLELKLDLNCNDGYSFIQAYVDGVPFFRAGDSADPFNLLEKFFRECYREGVDITQGVPWGLEPPTSNSCYSLCGAGWIYNISAQNQPPVLKLYGENTTFYPDPDLLHFIRMLDLFPKDWRFRLTGEEGSYLDTVKDLMLDWVNERRPGAVDVEIVPKGQGGTFSYLG